MQRGKPAKKYSQAGRLHAVIRLLETRHGVTLDDLAEECDIDRRTVHRDLNAISEAGYPLVSEWLDGKKMYRFITKSRNIPPITLTLNQILSLYLLRSLSADLAGTPFQSEIDALFREIRSVLPDRYAAHLERIARVSLPVVQGARDYSSASAFIEELQRALLYQFRVELLYLKLGGRSSESYQVDPYTLIFHKGGIYLLGYAHNRNDIRLFALERICGLTVTRTRFSIPDDYQPEEHFSSAFGLVRDTPLEVKVRFSPEVAPSISGRIWKSGQQITSDAQGYLTVQFTATGKKELLAWILSYGRHAEVLAPPELRLEIKQQIKEMREYYRNKEKKETKKNK